MIGIAHSVAQRDPIDLTDEFVEMSPVVKAVLDILYDQEVSSFSDCRLYHHVIEFARKYDMAIVLKTISKEIRVHATSPGRGHILRLFRIAIDLGDYDLMTAVYKSNGSHAWPKHVNTGLTKSVSLFPDKHLTLPEPLIQGFTKEYVPRAKAFELGGWPYLAFAALPTPLAWAMLRAGQTADKLFASDGPEANAKELQKILKSMCKLPSTT